MFSSMKTLVGNYVSPSGLTCFQEADVEGFFFFWLLAGKIPCRHASMQPHVQPPPLPTDPPVYISRGITELLKRGPNEKSERARLTLQKWDERENMKEMLWWMERALLCKQMGEFGHLDEYPDISWKAGEPCCFLSDCLEERGKGRQWWPGIAFKREIGFLSAWRPGSSFINSAKKTF